MIIVEVIAALVSVAGAVISVVIYLRTVKREAKIATLNVLRNLRGKYPDFGYKTDDEKTQYLKEMEFFCTGVNEKIYDINIVKKMSRTFLLSQYECVFKEFIKERKADVGQKNIYCEYENVIKKLRECE